MRMLACAISVTAATLAASRTSGRTPFTCQGTYLMLTPLLMTSDRLGFFRQHAGPTRHHPAELPKWCAAFDPDSLRITVKSKLIRARFCVPYFPSNGVSCVMSPTSERNLLQDRETKGNMCHTAPNIGAIFLQLVAA